MDRCRSERLRDHTGGGAKLENSVNGRVEREHTAVRRITFISSNRSWGGSEELWAATAVRLAEQGHSISAYKHFLPRDLPIIARLEALAARLFDLQLGARVVGMLPILEAFGSSKVGMAADVARLWARLRIGSKPDLVVISQGGNHDGWPLVSVCRRLRLPYVCICHKATDLYWPADLWRRSMRDAFASARWTFFVSEHNRRLTQEQIGGRIPRSSIVRNPFNVPWNDRPAWPSTGMGLRLGCVGRLNILEKGQDLLLRVLARDKWRSRPVSVTFLGGGHHRQGLEDMAAYLGLPNVRFAGTSDDIAGFWSDHHALVLPSRAEGLPLVLVEALLCGRIAIVTDVGGNAELLTEGVNGFIASGATEESLDAALERAWAHRHEWESLGAAAAEDIRKRIPADPAGDFAARIIELADPVGVEKANPQPDLDLLLTG